MRVRAVYPGTFDPVTLGHIDLIERAAHLFDEVIVAVAHNPAKRPLFSPAERRALLEKATRRFPNIVVDDFNGLVVEYVARKKASIIIRGLRVVSDFEYEFQIGLTNRKLDPDIETIFMMPKEQYSYISSKLIKEVAAVGAPLKDFVPGFVEQELKKKLRVAAGPKRTKGTL